MKISSFPIYHRIVLGRLPSARQQSRSPSSKVDRSVALAISSTCRYDRSYRQATSTTFNSSAGSYGGRPSRALPR